MKSIRKHAVAAALAFAAVAAGSAPAFADYAYGVQYTNPNTIPNQVQSQGRGYYDYVAPGAADPAPTYTPWSGIGGWKDLH
jgi:hypothetical protein